MTALVTQHLPLVAGAPEGIKRLRELILELAVSGRLIAQDASDESADLLLERIDALKEARIKSGLVKRQKATARVAVQQAYAIPESWRSVQLGEVVEIVRGITFPASEKSKEPSPGRIGCLRTANVQELIEWDDLLYIDESFVSRDDQFLQPHDIVMSMANSRELVGKVALVGQDLRQRSTFGGFLGVLRPYLIEPRFIMALLRTPSARSALIDSASQTTNIANISLGKLRPLMVALPPLAEQHRIVAKVDELMALCDRLEADQADAEAAHAQLVQALLDSLTQATDAAAFRAHWQRLSEHFHTLFTTEASIDALKQTVLQLGVMGKLVPQAADDEHAAQLIERARAEKERLLADGRLRKDRSTPNVAMADVPFAVPAAWVWTQMADVLNFLNGYAFKSEWFRPQGVRLLRNINVGHGVLDWRDKACIPDEMAADFAVFSLGVGDLVLTLDRPIISTGLKVAVLGPTDLPCLLLQRVAKISSYAGVVSTSYLSLWLNSAFFIGEIDPGRSNGVPHISTTQVGAMLIALPPLAEQHRIVAKVDELMALCDQLKAQLADARQQYAQMATALIEQAVA